MKFQILLGRALKMQKYYFTFVLLLLELVTSIILLFALRKLQLTNLRNKQN